MGLVKNKDEEINLVENLEIVFQDIKENKKLQMEIDEMLSKQHGILRGTLNEVMVNSSIIDNFDKIELAAFTSVIHQATDRNEIAPNKFFNGAELNKAKKYRRNIVEFEYPHTLNGVIKASDTEYSVVMSAKEIALWWNNEALTYNFQAQRMSKKTKKKDGVITEKADVKMKSVNKITKLMLNGKYKSNALLFNILVDGNDNIDYDDGELTLHEGTTVNLIDGMHRVQGLLSALEQDPDFERNFIVVITHLPLVEAQDMLSQVNTTNRFDKTLTKYYGSDKISSQVARDLMNIPELRHRVSIATSLDKKFNFLTNFAVLSEAIEAVFEPQNNKDRYDAADTLKKFFSYLINSFEDEFVKRINEFKKDSWINHHNTFVLYVALAKKLLDKYGADYPVTKIVEVVKSIDFSKQEGTPYNDVIAPQGKVNSNKIKKDIRAFAENIEV